MDFTDDELVLIQEAVQLSADDAASQAEWAREHDRPEIAESHDRKEERLYDLHDRILRHFDAAIAHLEVSDE